MPTPPNGAPAARRARPALAAWLRAQIAERGWTQEELAERIGTSQGTVAKWLQGRHEPTPASMQRIADALYVSLDDVMDAAGIRPQVAYDDPRVARIVHKLRAVEPSVERFRLLEQTLDVMLETDAAKAEAARRRKPFGEP